MSGRWAEEAVLWHYEPPYDIYDMANDGAAYLSDAGNRIYAGLRGSELIAVRSFGADGQVEGGSYDDSYLDTGGALRPDLTGRGLGEEIVRRGLAFGCAQFGTERRVRNRKRRHCGVEEDDRDTHPEDVADVSQVDRRIPHHVEGHTDRRHRHQHPGPPATSREAGAIAEIPGYTFRYLVRTPPGGDPPQAFSAAAG